MAWFSAFAIAAAFFVAAGTSANALEAGCFVNRLCCTCPQASPVPTASPPVTRTPVGGGGSNASELMLGVGVAAGFSAVIGIKFAIEGNSPGPKGTTGKKAPKHFWNSSLATPGTNH